ncbi:hypothetical protein [Salinigranum halophilum]|uniref:hypothetical protein n=1 Tax=Salinigranum halophilum TaxID=2565931 RepID=UPI00115E07BC|nr:hypothetical protein [Salinigranum halophilum]
MTGDWLSVDDRTAETDALWHADSAMASAELGARLLDGMVRDVGNWRTAWLLIGYAAEREYGMFLRDEEYRELEDDLASLEGGFEPAGVLRDRL